MLKSGTNDFKACSIRYWQEENEMSVIARKQPIQLIEQLQDIVNQILLKTVLNWVYNLIVITTYAIGPRSINYTQRVRGLYVVDLYMTVDK